MQVSFLKKPNGQESFQIIKRRPLMMFFFFSIAFTWIINWLMINLLGQESYTFSNISGFGPVLSAMFISSILNTERAEFKFGSWSLIFISTLFVAGLVRWISRIWWNHNMSWSVFPGEFVLVVLAAFVIACSCSPNSGIRSLLKPYLNWRVSWLWYLVAIGIWPGITFAGLVLGKWIGLPIPAAPLVPDAPLPLAVLVSFVWAVFFNGALGEEAGWRGFALPRLQQRFSPLMASIILGLVWGAFHWIFFFIGLRGNWLMFWVRLGDIPLAILFTWLYNRTKGKSLLPVLLMHAAVNATNDYLPRVKLTVYTLLGLVVLVVIFTDRMWRFKPIPETTFNSHV